MRVVHIGVSHGSHAQHRKNTLHEAFPKVTKHLDEKPKLHSKHWSTSGAKQNLSKPCKFLHMSVYLSVCCALAYPYFILYLPPLPFSLVSRPCDQCGLLFPNPPPNLT